MKFNTDDIRPGDLYRFENNCFIVLSVSLVYDLPMYSIYIIRDGIFPSHNGRTTNYFPKTLLERYGHLTLLEKSQC